MRLLNILVVVSSAWAQATHETVGLGPRGLPPSAFPAPAAKTGVHLGPRGVPLLELPEAPASKTGAHLGPSGVPLNEVTMLVAGGSCPANYPECYYDGDCVLSSCAHGCAWRNRINYINIGGHCSSNYVSPAGRCPSNYPVCYYDGDCVISSCANGCAGVTAPTTSALVAAAPPTTSGKLDVVQQITPCVTTMEIV
jgi:hypothetical protein